MGYRNYISRVKKTDLAKILLLPLDDYKSHRYKRDHTEELYEIGKYYDAPEDGFEVTHDVSGDEEEWKIITHESLLAIIRQYAKMHLEYLQNCIKPEDEMTELEKHEREFGHSHTATQFIKGQISQWERPEQLIYNIDLESDELVKSWNYQFVLFEILRIYKTFDTENYYVVYEGH